MEQHPNQYRVEGIPFDNPDTAAAFARLRAEDYGRPIHVMERVDGLSWHVVETANPANPARGFSPGRLA